MIAESVFIGIAVMTLIGAVLAVTLKNVFYNALSLILSLFGVACLFIYLNSEFLAVIEVIIYIGAIAIAIIFAIMLSQPMMQKFEARNPLKIVRSIMAAGLVGFGLWKVLAHTKWQAADIAGDYSLKAIGRSFLSTNLLPFEAVSVILLIAIIGALVISETKKAK